LIAPVIEGARVRLRPQILADFRPLAQMYETARSVHIAGPKPSAAVWRDFASDVGQWVLLGFGGWSVEERSTGALAGYTGLNAPPEYPERELGWIMLEGFEGKGYAFEAAALARAFAFEKLGWAECVSYVDPENYRSIRLAERLGAVRDDKAATPNGDPCLVYRHTRARGCAVPF
jgi:RimJ/RimL family protein N-acetyltransferase